MEINYWAVTTCVILSVAVGAIWYEPSFSHKWSEQVGVKPDDLETLKKKPKKAWFLYLAQFLITLFQIWVLAYFMGGWESDQVFRNMFWLWLVFVMPTIAGASLWGNDSDRFSWIRFLTQAGYQLVMFAIFGIILGMWN